MRKLSIEEMGRLSVEEFHEIPKRPLVAVLDNVRSMHNVGSLFRTADAFLLEKIYLCGITPTPPHREIRKTAIGAEESVAWEFRQDCPSLLQELKAEGYHALAVEQAAPSCPLSSFQVEEGAKYALIFGHEISGVSDEAMAWADLALEIPQFGTKHSLNISVAAGIVLYALSSQM